MEIERTGIFGRTPQRNQSKVHEAERVTLRYIETRRASDGTEIHTVLELSYERLSAEFGAVETPHRARPYGDNPLDLSPEAVSDRILAFATGFLPGVLEQGGSTEKFIEAVRSGFESGFSDAIKIIEGLNRMTPELRETLDKTRELFLSKLDALAAEIAPQKAA